MGAVFYPVLRYLTPPADGGGSNKVTLTDAQKQELTGTGFLIARLGTDRVLLVKEKDDKAARPLRQVHARGLHGAVRPRATRIVWCACHNGKFSLGRPGHLGSAAAAARGVSPSRET